MSEQSVREIFLRMLHDEDFHDRMLISPGTAIEGYDLTAAEVRALMDLGDASLSGVAVDLPRPREDPEAAPVGEEQIRRLVDSVRGASEADRLEKVIELLEAIFHGL
jgi:hypothetical protein